MNFTRTTRKMYLITSTIISLISIFLITYYTYGVNLENHTNLKKDNDRKLINEQVLKLTKMVEYSKSFLLFVSELRTLKDYSRNEISEKDFQEFLINMIKYSENYSQVRILSADGMEKFRINRLKNEIIPIPQNELQNKSNRYYYEDFKEKAIGAISISCLDPNIENGIIETPINPTIRMGFKLKNSEILIVNISLQNEFNNIRTSLLLENKKNFFIETNCGLWSISNNNIKYKGTKKIKDFYIKGFLSDDIQSNSYNKEILVHSLFENLKLILLLIISIFLITLTIFKYIYNKEVTSYIDLSTSCYNRNFYEKKMKKIKGLDLYNVCYIDIDSLKIINDKFGHTNGDILIKSIAESLKASFKNEYVIRIGGDEFLILSKLEKSKLDDKIESILSKLYLKRICDIPISFSYGIASEKKFEESIKKSEIKMYLMKKMKKDKGLPNLV